MKFFFILTILTLLSFKSISEEKKLEYFCKMETKFYEIDKNKWSQKTIDYDFYVSNNYEIIIFDKEVKSYLSSLKIVVNNNDALVGHFLNDKMINIFTFNKNTRYAKYSNTYYDKQGGGQIGIGLCYPKSF
tara:strand:+ start:249 stop:641 length:393 start_codon:yes stop_codon:yes gene_type:complete